MTKTVYLDVDGTWVDLYGVENWLDYLVAKNPYPYIVAKPMVNLSVLARTIHRLQANGYKVGIISWLAKNSNNEYDELVTDAKLDYFKKHLPSVQFDEIHIIPYGTPKATCGTGILFDDEEHNRIEWEKFGGIAFDEKDLLKTLRGLL